MDTFDIGETVILQAEVKNQAGSYVDPSTSMQISVYDPNGTAIVSDAAMTKDDTGKYHYDFQAAGKSKGKYTFAAKATNGARITIQKDAFYLAEI